MQITFNPADMNSAGIIYFRDSNATANSYLMSFVASKIQVQWVSGPKNLFFDFVGEIEVSLLWSFLKRIYVPIWTTYKAHY